MEKGIQFFSHDRWTHGHDVWIPASAARLYRGQAPFHNPEANILKHERANLVRRKPAVAPRSYRRA